MSQLRAGFGRASITPPVGILHGNWGAQTHSRASGIDLDLWVSAIALSSGDTTTIILDLDIGKIPVEDADVMRENIAEAIGTTPDAVRVSYTHTHAGPEWGPVAPGAPGKPGTELIEGYRQTVHNQVIGAARSAMNTLRPCRVSAGYGSSSIGVNRRLSTPDGRLVVGRNDEGFTDPTVLVVRIDDLDEHPIAAIVGYGAHPIILAFQNSLVSADYPGVVKQVVEQVTGAPTVFLQGCAGNQMTVEALTGDVQVPRTMGGRLGSEAARVFLSLKTRPTERTFGGVVESGAPLGMWDETPLADKDTPLAVATRSIRMPVRPLPDAADARAEADELMAHAVALSRQGIEDASVADANFRAKRSLMVARWSEWTDGCDHLDAEIHGIRIGPVGLIGFPGEPFAETGVDVRTESPLPFTQLAGYSNGWLGYVPTREEYPRGGYEVQWGSCYTDDAAALLRDEALALLNQLAGTS